MLSAISSGCVTPRRNFRPGSVTNRKPTAPPMTDPAITYGQACGLFLFIFVFVSIFLSLQFLTDLLSVCWPVGPSGATEWSADESSWRQAPSSTFRPKMVKRPFSVLAPNVGNVAGYKDAI